MEEVNGKADKGDVFTSIPEMCLAFAINILIFGFLQNLEVLLKDKVVAVFIYNGFVSLGLYKHVTFPIKL